MSGTSADKFIETTRHLLHLWQAVRVSGMALYHNGHWFNAGIRVQLLEDPPTKKDIESPDQRFLYYVIDYPLELLPHVIGQLTGGSVFNLEKDHGAGGAFAEISLKTPGQPGLGVNWYPPIKREPTTQQRSSGVRRTSIALVSSGQMLQEIIDHDLRIRLDSKLRYAEPGHDGLAGLAKQLFPGTGFENWQQTLVEIVAELPFEIEATNSGKFRIRASPRAKDSFLTTVCFYEPHVGIRPVRTVLRHDEGGLQNSMLQWDRIVDWPEGAEQTKVTLFYGEEEIQSFHINRKAQMRAERAEALQAERKRPAPASGPPPTPKQSQETTSLRGMPIFKTALETYQPLKIVGTGGAGVVYKVETDDRKVFAIKCLDPQRATTEKRKRFKTELFFCAKNEHRNIITVLDQGIASIKGEDSPFYVMPYYAETLRDLMKLGIPHERVLPLFSQVLDGVEAAHLKNVWHRDLKPENILYDRVNQSYLVADFGIAHFAEEELYTLVETKAHERLANFQYAAPEQRARGSKVDHRADIFALGLVLNEMFTGHVIQGEGYARISKVAPELSYLDDIIAKMIQQSPDDRPNSISEIKQILIAKGNEFISRQKLDALRQIVVPSRTATDPLIQNPIQVEGVDIRGDILVAILNQAPPPEWIRVFVHPRAMSYIPGTEPANWRFTGKEATVRLGHIESYAKQVLNNFRDYVRGANALYKEVLENTARQLEENEKRALQQKIAEEEKRQRILKSLRS